MPHPYTEEQLVEQPSIKLFAELGWQTVLASDEVFGTSGTLGRESSGEVVLVPRLRTALKRLNPTLPTDAIAATGSDCVAFIECWTSFVFLAVDRPRSILQHF